jgi:hypothetical protein
MFEIFAKWNKVIFVLNLKKITSAFEISKYKGEMR